MPDKDYPIGMYKSGESDPQYAHSPKDEKTLQQDGYSEGAASIGKLEYPKMLYNKTGGTKVAATKDEEQKLSGKGYSDKPVLPQEIPHSRDRQPGDRSRIDDLEDQLEQLKEQLAQSQQGGQGGQQDQQDQDQEDQQGSPGQKPQQGQQAPQKGGKK